MSGTLTDPGPPHEPDPDMQPTPPGAEGDCPHAEWKAACRTCSPQNFTKKGK